MSEITKNINDIYALLKSKGIDKSYIREVLLPKWWDEEILSSKAGFLQTASIIAKNLGIKLSDLLAESDELHLTQTIPINFKQNKSYNTLTTDFFPQTLSAKLFSLIKSSFKKDFTLSIDKPDELRKDFLSVYDEINLNNLLDYLWKKGIPVIYVSEYPKDVNKLDGMVFNFENRPVIIVSSKRKHDAWLIFILAHEVGHIAKKHLNNSENVIFDSNFENAENGEEKEANDFAIKFLIENEDNVPSSLNLGSSFKLVNQLRPIGNTLKLDPGVITLMYAFRSNNFMLGSQALNVMDPEPDASSKVKAKMKEFLDLNNLTEEELEYFENLTGVSGG
ncbi:MAG TPA: ImmA/IrrE family metallo-endopeptidase [Ignavibacteria bacterium]|nr:ImmA/IrrE family metallo-endopeptidase [Ignavibacteria bacterium]